ncbi:hypothetical protein KSS87_018699 [Heliosperma pusillum]|nr:hypothetical protein KSS87_018699 [Heliosperma pusillum]
MGFLGMGLWDLQGRSVNTQEGEALPAMDDHEIVATTATVSVFRFTSHQYGITLVPLQRDSFFCAAEEEVGKGDEGERDAKEGGGRRRMKRVKRFDRLCSFREEAEMDEGKEREGEGGGPEEGHALAFEEKEREGGVGVQRKGVGHKEENGRRKRVS